jgi:hypothetical protein
LFLFPPFGQCKQTLPVLIKEVPKSIASQIEEVIKELLDLPNGIPSHDTFGRVFALSDPKQFEVSFMQWVQGLSRTVKGVIAIDGKTLRRSHDQEAGKKALHLVSAWAVENRLVLAQLARRQRNPTRLPPSRSS